MYKYAIIKNNKYEPFILIEMEIINSNNGEYNFPEELRPLFEAMEAGQKIKSVTCMKGNMNKSDTSKDFKIEDFIALSYWVAIGWSEDNGNVDYVVTGPTELEQNFYMCWVRSFELY